jgi:hypothetical protein
MEETEENFRALFFDRPLFKGMPETSEMRKVSGISGILSIP